MAPNICGACLGPSLVSNERNESSEWLQFIEHNTIDTHEMKLHKLKHINEMERSDWHCIWSLYLRRYLLEAHLTKILQGDIHWAKDSEVTIFWLGEPSDRAATALNTWVNLGYVPKFTEDIEESEMTESNVSTKWNDLGAQVCRLLIKELHGVLHVPVDARL